MTSSLTPVSGTTSPSVGCRLPLANSSSTTAESLASSVSTLCCPACNSLCPASKASRRAALFRTIVGMVDCSFTNCIIGHLSTQYIDREYSLTQHPLSIL
ncbi:hypothetical protein ACOSP7_014017 [Xanthoceras sorbifolium]